MRYLNIIFNRAIPFYLWVGIVYALFVTVMALTTSSSSAPAGMSSETLGNAAAVVEDAAGDAADAVGDVLNGEAPAADTADMTNPLIASDCNPWGEQLYQRVERALSCSIVTIPLFSSAEFGVDWTVIFIVLGFIAAWIEVVRATNIRDTARNDTWSLVVTIIAFVLFVGVSSFGTTAFMIVALVGFGDVLLDRYVGQAVARRDFGGMFGGGG